MVKLKKWVFLILALEMGSIVFASPWALVLTGGGARGAYEAGALKAVKELRLDVKGVYGTSVGALNGAFFCQGITDELYNMWQELSYSNVMSIPSTPSNKNSNLYFRIAQRIFTFHLIDVKPLRKLVSEYLNEEEIRKSGISFGIVTYDLSKFTPVEIYLSEIPDGKLLDYVMASANYPIFQRQVINGSMYIDGGVYNNAPVDMALKKGFSKILLINVSDIPISLPPIPEGVELKTINPSGSLGNAMNFNPEDEKRLEEMGYLDTMKSFGKFVGENYYIYPPKRPILIDALLSMDATELSKIADTLGLNISGYSRNFAVYSIIIPKISEIVKSTSFESLNLDLLETAAEEFGIDRLVPYTQRELVKVIAQSDRQLHSNFLFFQRNNDEVVESIREICKFIVSKGIICN
jgi:NTE family protein